ENGLIFDLMGQENQPGAGFVLIKLGQERAQHLARSESRVGLRKVGAVAPVLPRAEEEHLDAALAAFLVNGENIRFLDPLRVYALMALHVGKRSKAVAIDGRALEIERLRGLLHGGRDLRLHLAGAAGKEVLRLGNQTGIIFCADLAGARPRTALDLVQQAGPRAAFEDRVRAGADEEGALEGVDRTSHGARGGERPEVVALARARATVFEKTRGRMIAGKQDIGKRLVVAQKHVEARTQAFDEVG